MCTKSLEELGLLPDIVPRLKDFSPLPSPRPNMRVTRKMSKRDPRKRFPNLDEKFEDSQWEIIFSKGSQTVTYVLLQLLYRSMSINGRATVCYKGRQLVSGRPQGDYVAIKRSFQDKGRLSEKDIIGNHGQQCYDSNGGNDDTSKYMSQILYSRDIIPKRPFIDKVSFDTHDNDLLILYRNKLREVKKHNVCRELAKTFKDHERTCRIQVMSPLGYPLANARSYEEAIRAIRDAVLGHKHAMEKHNLLHRDVSIGNIMIGVDKCGSTFGFLTDFDLAKKPESPGFAVASHRSGTIPYMSIPILENCLWHTSRDDSESFFRVLLHICDLKFNPNSDPNLVKSLDRSVDNYVPNAIQECWNTPFLKLAEYHRLKMSPVIFESDILSLECSKYKEIKKLLLELHKIIFPNGTIILGRFKDPIHHSECDFDQMTKAFDKCLKALKTRRFNQQ